MLFVFFFFKKSVQLEKILITSKIQCSHSSQCGGNASQMHVMVFKETVRMQVLNLKHSRKLKSHLQKMTAFQERPAGSVVLLNSSPFPL